MTNLFFLIGIVFLGSLGFLVCHFCQFFENSLEEIGSILVSFWVLFTWSVSWSYLGGGMEVKLELKRSKRCVSKMTIEWVKRS